MWRAVRFITKSAVLFLLAGVASAQATTLPFVSVGDTFTGSFSLDTATPLYVSYPNALSYYPAGSLVVNIGGDIFSASGGVGVYPGALAPNITTWVFFSDPSGTINGAPVDPFLVMDLIFYENTNSTGILPVDFSLHNVGNTLSDDNIQIFAGLNYQGFINSLTLEGNVGTVVTFDFSGTFAACFNSPCAYTPLPAALPLFATSLGAFGLLGWRRKRKARAVA